MENFYISFKASSVSDSEPIENLVLSFTKSVPNTNVLEHQRAIFQFEAKIICDLLLTHLPQGLTDHLMAELCKRKATLFHIPQESNKEPHPLDYPYTSKLDPKIPR